MVNHHCTKCAKTTEHRHVHDTAHGIDGTHMGGSERFECVRCSTAIYASAPASARGNLRFTIDKTTEHHDA